jgi:hypothetical protein
MEVINLIVLNKKMTYTEIKRKIKKDIKNDEQFKLSILETAKNEQINISLQPSNRGVAFIHEKQ